jgi:hypothetical protein
MHLHIGAQSTCTIRSPDSALHAQKRQEVMVAAEYTRAYTCMLLFTCNAPNTFSYTIRVKNITMKTAVLLLVSALQLQLVVSNFNNAGQD